MIMRQLVRCYSGVVVTNEIGCWNNRFPRAEAGFGQYRGNDRVIFWMERQ